MTNLINKKSTQKKTYDNGDLLMYVITKNGECMNLAFYGFMTDVENTAMEEAVKMLANLKKLRIDMAAKYRIRQATYEEACEIFWNNTP